MKSLVTISLFLFAAISTKFIFAINRFSDQQDTVIIMPNGINTQQRRGGGSFNKIEKIGRY